MNFNEYQESAKSTAIYPSQVKGVYPLLGLIGETCETVEKLVGDPDLINETESATMDELADIFRTAIIVGKRAETLKKELRRNGENFQGEFRITSEDYETELLEVTKELGDILWYLAAVASDFGISLEDVAVTNYNKLKSRQERGVLQGSGDNR